MERIVVGIDGSPHAAAAVRWAHTEAMVHEAALEVVMAWHWGDQRHADPTAPFDPAYTPADAHEALHTYAEVAIGDAVDDVVLTAVLDLPARALLTTAADSRADLLVVGSRGRGGFAGLLLGSVSQQVVSHAPCPVVVIPAVAE